MALPDNETKFVPLSPRCAHEICPSLPLRAGMTMEARLYSLDSSVGLAGVARLCNAILQIEATNLSHAFIDAISDFKELPSHVQEALDELMRLANDRFRIQSSKGLLGRRRLQKGPSPMGLELDLSNSDHIELLNVFGPYSIHAEAYKKSDRKPFLVMHDSGTSVTFYLAESQIRELGHLSGLSEDSFEEITRS